jgi:hypothetical protein
MSETDTISQMHAKVDAFEKKLDEQKTAFHERGSLIPPTEATYAEIKQAKHDLKRKLDEPGVDWEELKLEFERDMAILETRFDHWTRYNDLHFNRGKR